MSIEDLAIKKALSLGADEAEAYLSRAETVKVDFTDEIESFKTVSSQGIGLRVVLGKRVALHSTSILGEKEAEEVAATAVKVARVSPEDPEWRRLNASYGRSGAEGYHDESLSSLGYDEIVEKVVSAIDVVRAHDKRVKPTRGMLILTRSKTSIANSYGARCERAETHVGAYIRAKASEAGMESVGTEEQYRRHWRELDLAELASVASEKALAFLRASTIGSREAPVVFRNKVFASILDVMLSGPVTADWVQKGRSQLAGKLGTGIASEDISIVDDGLMRGGWATRPFDDEGHPTQRTSILDRGILKGYLYDNYTALKDDVPSTGNSTRPNYWAAPQPSPSNLILKAGTASPDEIIGDTMEGIYVERTIGEWLSNPVSGELNATVSQGYLIEKRELTQPIKGVVVSGNFYEVLRGGVEAIGSDLANSVQSYSPTVKISKLTVAGK